VLSTLAQCLISSVTTCHMDATFFSNDSYKTFVLSYLYTLQLKITFLMFKAYNLTPSSVLHVSFLSQGICVSKWRLFS
jgi:heme/copper-type cytochrome/quinol oxidase subunit 3